MIQVAEQPPPPYSAEQRRTLLGVAADSIRHGLQAMRPLPIELSDYPAPLRELRASFVTLTINADLRGCIGGLEPRWPLVQDVAYHACAAAFRDPRFAPVTPSEVESLRIHVAVLSVPEPVSFHDEPDLLRQLRPNVDGLVLEEPACNRRGTFLPAVWETLPEPRRFLTHLKQKAGLPADYWSDTLRVWRYTTESMG